MASFTPVQAWHRATIAPFWLKKLRLRSGGDFLNMHTDQSSSAAMARPGASLPATLALLFVTIVWGTTFATMKTLQGALSPLAIMVLRFVLAAAVLAAIGWRDMRAAEWRWGLALGVLQFAGFWLQIEGLMHTSANRNAFVTGLNVLMVPLIATLFLGQRSRWRIWAACALALGGMALMFYEDAPWGWGDTVTLGGALCFAVFILTMEASAVRNAHAPLRPTRLVLALSCSVIACSVLMLAVQGEMASFAAQVAALDQQQWLVIVYLGLVASALMDIVLAWGQQRVDATRSAIIYGMEPVFAAVAAWLLIGEAMTAMAMVGAACVVAALIVSQLKAARD